MKTLIVYHKEDNDGAMSGALALYWLTKVLNNDISDIETLGVDYNYLTLLYKDGTINTWSETYAKIIMTDISFNDWKVMKHMHDKMGSSFIWIDHHAPIIKESIKHGFDTIEGIRDSSRSAILNMFHYLFDPLDISYTNKTCPELLRVLSAYDSFSFEREGYAEDYVKRINAAFNVKFDINILKHYELLDYIMCEQEDTQFYPLWIGKPYNDTLLSTLNDVGSIIMEYDKQRYAAMIASSAEYGWTVDGNRQAAVLFLEGQTSSGIFETAKNIQNGIVFKHTSCGNWIMSLYNIDWHDTSFHCGEYLKKKYKGGGHAGAAGCTLNESQFKRILKNKSI